MIEEMSARASYAGSDLKSTALNYCNFLFPLRLNSNVEHHVHVDVGHELAFVSLECNHVMFNGEFLASLKNNCSKITKQINGKNCIKKSRKLKIRGKQNLLFSTDGNQIPFTNVKKVRKNFHKIAKNSIKTLAKD